MIEGCIVYRTDFRQDRHLPMKMLQYPGHATDSIDSQVWYMQNSKISEWLGICKFLPSCAIMLSAISSLPFCRIQQQHSNQASNKCSSALYPQLQTESKPYMGNYVEWFAQELQENGKSCRMQASLHIHACFYWPIWLLPSR